MYLWLHKLSLYSHPIACMCPLGLLSAQLLLTVAVTAVFLFHQPTKLYVLSNPWTFWVAFASGFGILIYLGCSEGARRRHPENMIWLFLFTLSEAFIVGTASSMYQTDIVFMAMALTGGLTLMLSAYAMQTKRDFTTSGGVLFTLLYVFIFGAIINMFFHVKMMNLIISVCGAFLFSAYIIFDIQLLMGGHKLEISPDEYVFAALNLYLDIINLFLYLLQILQEVNSR